MELGTYSFAGNLVLLPQQQPYFHEKGKWASFLVEKTITLLDGNA